MPNNKIIFKIAFPSSTSPFIEKIFFIPLIGSNLLPLKASALVEKFMPPTAVCVMQTVRNRGSPTMRVIFKMNKYES